MPRTESRNDFDHFDDWETFDLQDDIYSGAESDLLDDWEDDGAIAQVREPVTVVTTTMELKDAIEDAQVDEGSAEVFSLTERSKAKRSSELMELSGPSEDELSTIEEVGIDDYIDIVLAEDAKESKEKVSAGEESLDSLQAERNVEEQEPLPQTLSPENTSASSRAVSEIEAEDDVDEAESDFSSSLDKEVLSFGEEEVELVVRPLFEGIAVSLPTLFDEDGEVEYKTTARLAKRLTGVNVNAVFVATNDGEGQTLSRKERKNLVKNVVKVTDAPVVVDITAPSTRQSVQIANDCAEAGAKAFVLTLDSTTRDPYALCEAIHSQHKDAALIVRLVGDPEMLPITPEFLYDLPITGVIDGTADAAFFLYLVSSYSGPVYVGSTSLVALGHLMGASGVVLASVAINNDLVESAFSGNAAAQAELVMIERETSSSPMASSRSIKLALESEYLVSSTMRD